MQQEIKERIDMISKGGIPNGYKKSSLGILPYEWDIKKLSDVNEITTGGTPLRNIEEYYNDGAIPWVKTTDLNNSYIKETEEKISEKALKETSVKLVKKNSILVAMYGGFNQIGRTGLLTIEGTTNQAIASFYVDEKSFCAEFILHWLNSKRGLWSRIAASSRKDPNITKKDVENFPIVFPEYIEQQKIAAILSTWDKAIELKEKLIAQKQVQKKGLAQNLLTGKIRVNEIGSINHEQLKQRLFLINKGEVPEGYQKVKHFIIPSEWNYLKINKIAEQINEINNSKCNTYKVLSCTKYNGLVDSIEYFKKKVFSDDLSAYKVVKRNNFVYATNHIEEGSIGLQNICDIGLVSPMYTVFKVKEEVNTNFIYAILKTETYRRIFETMMSASVNRRGSLRWKDFSRIKVPIPPKEEQQKIIEILTVADQELQLLQQELALLKQQKKGLMQLLLTGIVRVKY